MHNDKHSCVEYFLSEVKLTEMMTLGLVNELIIDHNPGANE